MSTVLPATFPDRSHLAVAGFLARYREPTAGAYRRDLRCFWQWCADRDLSPLAAKRPHFELYLRDLERRGYATATISRRLSTLAGLFKYAVIDELVPTNPTLAVTRPGCPGKGSGGPCCTRSSSPQCSAPPGSTAPRRTPLSPCSECTASASAKPSTPRSRNCGTPAQRRGHSDRRPRRRRRRSNSERTRSHVEPREPARR